jgi:hypothetical protein
MKFEKDAWIRCLAVLAVIAAIALFSSPPAALAAPTAEVAKRCLHYSYLVYPFKRPGAVPMSGDRQAYFRDCMAKNGDVPAPARPNQAGATTEKTDAPATKNNASPTESKE